MINNNLNTNNINNNKEEKIMTNITKEVINPKNTVEIITEINEDGTKLEYLAIEGNKIAVMGYANEDDKRNAINCVNKIVQNSDKTGSALIMEIMTTLQTGASMTEVGIEAKESEEDMIDDVPVIINYKENKIYVGTVTMDGPELEEIANLEDMECAPSLPAEAIKALLMERGKNKIAEMKAAMEEGHCNYDDNEEEDDEYDDENRTPDWDEVEFLYREGLI